jgi:hypothetical protein
VSGVANDDAVRPHVNQRNHCNVIHAVPQMQEEPPAKRPRLDTRDDGMCGCQATTGSVKTLFFF